MRLTRLNQLIRGREQVQGSWRLTPRHEVQYRKKSPREEMILSGPLVTAGASGLTFRVEEQSEDGGLLKRQLTLQGRWEADAGNRLTFLADRQTGREDRLTLSGGWEVEENLLLYRFEQLDEKARRPKIHTLAFRGSWEINDPHHLTYLLEGASDSAFRFRGAFQTSSVLAKKGEVRYQVGIGLEGKHRLKTVTLFGKWKLSRELALAFEMASTDGRRPSLLFGASYQPSSRDTLTANLTTRQGKPLGVEVIFNRQLLRKQGEAFLRLRKSLEESVAEGGFRFRW